MSAPTMFDELGPNTSTIERWETWPIRLSQIKEREGHNPRKDYGEHDGSFAALVESIRERGVLEPPRLMPICDSRGEWEYQETEFFVVHGHRRVAAARALGLECIRCIVPDAEGIELTYYTEGQQLVDALVENLQRKELNCIEVAEGIARLEKLGKTQADIARWIGKDQGRVSKTVRLLELPVGVRALLREGALSASHGEELLPLLSESFLPGEIYSLAQSAVDMSLTKAGLRNVVQDKIKRCQPVQTTIDEVEETGAGASELCQGDYAPAHNSKPDSTCSVETANRADKEPKPAPKDDNGLTRKDSDNQFAAAMAADPDVVPLSELPAPDRFQQPANLPPQELPGLSSENWAWLEKNGMSANVAVSLLAKLVRIGCGADLVNPGHWLRIDDDGFKHLLDLCDWQREDGQAPLDDDGVDPMARRLGEVLAVYHHLMLERRVGKS